MYSFHNTCQFQIFSGGLYAEFFNTSEIIDIESHDMPAIGYRSHFQEMVIFQISQKRPSQKVDFSYSRLAQNKVQNCINIGTVQCGHHGIPFQNCLIFKK